MNSAAMIDAAMNLTAASEVARNNWNDARKWKRLAMELGRELAEREAAADVYMEVRRGAVIFREDARHGR